ncbi:MAG TPA: enoyl-CoA hydratase-related protein [Ideonella sp.]|uniref:enoyl-CoA hydratase/isomerase family protein n=1 Tax=Ideonella sp. TaxID=1929293 RepID=UPI002B720CA7|nr:enoyl-CoA hydratase-related protein [Ideonella sp.]HSI51151.1 enoyl-CoA hydratase-related protein [Ideonella sp.]
MSDPLLLVRRQALQPATAGVVLHLTLNRPEARNAMSLALVDALIAALAEAEAAGDVRAIVLRGAGGHFCAGGDLKDMAAARAQSLNGEHTGEDPFERISARFGELCVAFANTGIATVALLQGTVMGGGFGLACVVDVALASADARFRLPETSLGVLPAQIAPFLVDRLGPAEARRLAVTGATLDGAQALAKGLVHELMPDAQSLEAAVERTLAGILRCAPQALAATKRLIAQARWQPAPTLVPAAAHAFASALQGDEGVEGTLAFLQKRPAYWVPQ